MTFKAEGVLPNTEVLNQSYQTGFHIVEAATPAAVVQEIGESRLAGETSPYKGIEVDINLSYDGQTPAMLTAILFDESDNEVARGKAQINGEAGSVTATILFEGEKISDSNINGNYVVKNLLLINSVNGNLISKSDLEKNLGSFQSTDFIINDDDNDGLSNATEENLGTDPTLPDTDNDGLTDFQEVNLDGNPAGNGLADHPMGFIGKVRAKKEYAGIFKKLSLIDMGYYISRSAVRLKSNCGKYTCCAFFRPALSMQNKLSIYKYKSLLGASKGAERLKNALSLKILHPDILAEIFSHLCGMNLSSSVYNILVIFDQKRGNSRVYNEENGLKVDWNISEEEISVYNGILKKLKDLLLPISERLEIKIPITEKWLWSAAHHSGTIALGNSAESGIIDNNLKLHLFDNVFICDGSIIQEHSYANTGLTIGQLAMRLARHLSNQSAA